MSVISVNEDTKKVTTRYPLLGQQFAILSATILGRDEMVPDQRVNQADHHRGAGMHGGSVGKVRSFYTCLSSWASMVMGGGSWIDRKFRNKQ